MAASVQYRQQDNSFGTAEMNGGDDDLALFLQMRNIDDDDDSHKNFLLHSSNQFDDSLGSEPDHTSVTKMASTMAEEKSDFEWLLAPPDTAQFPSLVMESQETASVQILVSNQHSTATKPNLANTVVEPTSRSNSTLKRSGSSTSTTTKLMPQTTRSSTPTRKPTLSSITKSSRSSTPTSRSTLPSATKPSRSSTPSSRSTLPSTKPKVPSKRSSTPTNPSNRSSTPSSRPSVLTAASKSTSKSSTPTRKPSTMSDIKQGPALVKISVPTCGSSPTVKPRPLKDNNAHLSEGLSAPNARSASTNGRQSRQSCSPLRGINGYSAYDNMRSRIAKSRGRVDSNDDVNPVLMGTQMVERVVNMRKLAPPKHDDYLSNHNKNNNSSGKSSSSQESSGFGRSLSKKSFDMALRHMDIRRSIPGNLRSLMTNVPASSVYSVRPGPAKSATVSISDSPLATSSSASSELSFKAFNNNQHGLDWSEARENDFGSET